MVLYDNIGAFGSDFPGYGIERSHGPGSSKCGGAGCLIKCNHVEITSVIAKPPGGAEGCPDIAGRQSLQYKRCTVFQSMVIVLQSRKGTFTLHTRRDSRGSGGSVSVLSVFITDAIDRNDGLCFVMIFA